MSPGSGKRLRHPDAVVQGTGKITGELVIPPNDTEHVLGSGGDHAVEGKAQRIVVFDYVDVTISDTYTTEYAEAFGGRGEEVDREGEGGRKSERRG